MNIKELHTKEKGVSATSIFKTEQSNATSIQILQSEQLKEHITKTPALLICLEGKVVFENEKGMTQTMMKGDYLNIEPLVKHWINAIQDSQLILVK